MSELSKRIITSFFLLLIVVISFIEIKILYLLIFFISFLALDEFIKIIKKIYKKNNFKQFLFICFSIFYMTLFSLIIVLFLIQSFEINKIKILFLLFVCISTDIGGYILGKLIGGKKLTKISPNKTYSGSIGSFIFALIVGYLFYYTQIEIKNLQTNIYLLIITISLSSQIGDLIISYFKRKAKIKDTGSFLPGHGGLLDRIDGIIFALPLGVIFISI